MQNLDPRLIESMLLLALVGALIAWARNLPAQLWRLLSRHFTVEVISREQELVKYVGVTAVELWRLGRRRTTALLRTNQDRSDLAFEPARGLHVLRWRGRFVLLDRGKEDSGSPGRSDSIQAMLALENVSLRGLGRDPSWLHEMMSEALTYGEKRFREKCSVRMSDGWNNWSDMDNVGPPRSLDSVILPDGIVERLSQAIATFLASAALYEARGVPWRLGIGIFGPPGTGKGSLVRALCGAHGLPLHILDVGNKNLTDAHLMKLLSVTGVGSAVLFDDLDATRSPSRTDAPGGITLGGLFGALDGPGAAHGQIAFLCSNHPEKLDPAMLRPGRVDIRIDLGPADADQAKRLYLRWFPDDHDGAVLFGDTGAGRSMAELQQALMVIAEERRT